MHLLKRCVLGLSACVALLLGVVFMPASASAQYYYDGYANYQYSYNYNNCNSYVPHSGYGNYWDDCNAGGMLTVYVQVNNQYGAYRGPSDFTFYVSGARPSQQYFTGSANGTTIWVKGSYSVSVYNQVGYNPTYSSGCSGSLAHNETRVCYVTLTSTYQPTYPYLPPSYHYPPPVYTPPVTYQAAAPVAYTASYIPLLPNTGFAPTSKAAIAFSLAFILVCGVLLFPYVRKSFIAVLR